MSPNNVKILETTIEIFVLLILIVGIMERSFENLELNNSGEKIVKQN